MTYMIICFYSILLLLILDLESLARLEKEKKIHPNPEIDAFMKVESHLLAFDKHKIPIVGM